MAKISWRRAEYGLREHRFQTPKSVVFFGPRQVPGGKLSELLSAYYLFAKANSSSASQRSPRLKRELSKFSLLKQYSRNSIPSWSSAICPSRGERKMTMTKIFSRQTCYTSGHGPLKDWFHTTLTSMHFDLDSPSPKKPEYLAPQSISLTKSNPIICTSLPTSHDDHCRRTSGGAASLSALLGSDNSLNIWLTSRFRIRSAFWWCYTAGGPLTNSELSIRCVLAQALFRTNSGRAFALK